MASERLTKTVIDAAIPRTDKPNCDFYIWDTGKGAVSGFGLKVTPAGGKIFVFQYRLKGAKSDRRYKIGRYGDWTVELARERARELRRMVDAKEDPFEHDKALAKAGEQAKRDAVDRAFDAVADRWLKAYRVERRTRGARKGRARSASTLQMVDAAANFLIEQFGKRRIDEIHEADLAAALDKMPAQHAATRRNTFASARILWGWARKQRLVSDNPLDRMDAPPAPESRDRTLSDAELALIWRASRKLPYPFGPAFRILALTGQRRSEVAAMQWQELDREARKWEIPSDRTKNGLVHIVPLSDAVIAELDAIAPKDEWPVKGFVFSTKAKTAVSGHSGAKRRLDAKIAELVKEEKREDVDAWRVHDFRRTVATGFQRLGVRFEVTEAVLNHVSGSRGGIAGVYQRHDWAKEKQEALAAWADHLLSLVRPKPVPAPQPEATEAG